MQIKTSKKEILDLVVAWLIISLAFAVILKPVDVNFLSPKFPVFIFVALITVGFGFLLHELAHKLIAQKYECWAEFRADMPMLLLALLISFAGIIIAAPGAVMIYGRITKKQNGIISLGGPVVNLILATVFLLATIFLNAQGIWQFIISYGFIINSWLALFNMIPFGNFDGIKVYRWNKAVYFSFAILSLIFVVVSFIYR